MGQFGNVIAKDDMRSRIIKLNERYRSACDEPTASHRFRVRGELLITGEEFFTVEIGCKLGNDYIVPWGEYNSIQLEVDFGRKIEHVKNVRTAIRRSPDRLGRALSLREALSMEGSDEWRKLLMSNKDFGGLKREVREKLKGLASSPLVNNKVSAPSYYERSSSVAKQQMEHERNSSLHSRKKSWDEQVSDEAEEEEILRRRSDKDSSSFEQRGSQSRVGEGRINSVNAAGDRIIPSPNPGVSRAVPVPTRSETGRVIPPPSTRG